MAFPGRHIEAGSLIGSWPILPSVITGTTTLLPRTMQTKATILGIKREPTSGYDVDGRSFILNVDGVDKVISFSYGGLLPLSVVISQINADVGSTVAFNDNGFLRLQSTTLGGASYLKVKTDPSSSPTNVLTNLGLFPEVEAFAGDLLQAQHVDPDRQVATPGQMTMSEGENFEARVFNRAIAQLAINVDRSEGQISKKRVATRSTYPVASYAPGATHGVQLAGDILVYGGKTSSPGTAELEKLFAVLDSNGRELAKEVFTTWLSGHTATFSATTDGNSRQQAVTSYSFWTSAEVSVEKGNYYLVSSSFTGGATVLNGKPLKVLEVLNATTIVIENIDPATGQRVAITDASISFTVYTRNITKVLVNGVFENVTTAAAGTPRLENNKVNKRTGLTPTRIELGNRIVCVGQDFTASPAIRVGDIVTWSGATINTPFNNNGDYRVDKIIDRETLQVVSADWGAALLNPNVSVGVGTIAIKTDGLFIRDPFLRFQANSTSPAPDTGQTLEIAFLQGTTIREATDDNPAIFQQDVRFTQESDDSITKALLRMWGQSATSLDAVLYADERINIESINYRLNHEHYTYDDTEKTGSAASSNLTSWGRHKDIRPDTLDMWYWTPALTTPRVILRGTGTRGHSDSNLTGDSLLQVRNSSDLVTLQVDSDGRIYNRALASEGDVRTFMDLQFNEPETGPFRLGGASVSGDRTIWKGKHRWYSATASGSSDGLIGQQLLFDLEMTSSSAIRFDRIIGQRIQIDSTTNHAVWSNDLKFLELTGSLNKTVTNHGDNQDSVSTFYGIHVNYTLAADFKINSHHYGLKIGDITRAGTAVGGSGTNYAIHTGLGLIHFGDAGEIDGNWLPIDDSTYDLGGASNQWARGYFGGGAGATATIVAKTPNFTSGSVFHAILPSGEPFGNNSTGAALYIRFAGNGDKNPMLDGIGANGLTATTGSLTHGATLNGSAVGSLLAGNGGWDSTSASGGLTWSGDGGNGLLIQGGIGGKIPGDWVIGNPSDAGAGGWGFTAIGGAGGNQEVQHDDTEETGIGGAGLIATGGRGGDTTVGSSGLNARGGDAVVATGGRAGGNGSIGGGVDNRGGYGILAVGGTAANIGPAGDGGHFTGGAGQGSAIPSGFGVWATGGAGFWSGSAGSSSSGPGINDGVQGIGGRNARSSSTSGGGGAGVRGLGGEGSGNGILSSAGPGVQGIGGPSGANVNDSTGYGGLFQAGTATGSGKIRSALRLIPQPAPTIGQLGDLYVDSADNKLKICTVAGSPGTWVVVGTQV